MNKENNYDDVVYEISSRYSKFVKRENTNEKTTKREIIKNIQSNKKDGGENKH